MNKIILLLFIGFTHFSFSQLDYTEVHLLNGVKKVDTKDLRNMAIKSTNDKTIIYTFGIWCSPCKLHLKNAISLKEKYDINLLILLIETENDKIIDKTIDYLYKIDQSLNIVLLKDKYGKKRNKKYKKFLKEITPNHFENLSGMSKYIVLNQEGKIDMVTTWKDNRNYDWKDDINMIKEKIIPIIKMK